MVGPAWTLRKAMETYAETLQPIMAMAGISEKPAQMVAQTGVLHTVLSR